MRSAAAHTLVVAVWRAEARPHFGRVGCTLAALPISAATARRWHACQRRTSLQWQARGCRGLQHVPPPPPTFFAHAVTGLAGRGSIQNGESNHSSARRPECTRLAPNRNVTARTNAVRSALHSSAVAGALHNPAMLRNPNVRAHIAASAAMRDGARDTTVADGGAPQRRLRLGGPLFLAFRLLTTSMTTPCGAMATTPVLGLRVTATSMPDFLAVWL